MSLEYLYRAEAPNTCRPFNDDNRCAGSGPKIGQAHHDYVLVDLTFRKTEGK